MINILLKRNSLNRYLHNLKYFKNCKKYILHLINIIYKNVETNLFLKYLYNLLGLSFNSDNFIFCTYYY